MYVPSTINKKQIKITAEVVVIPLRRKQEVNIKLFALVIVVVGIISGCATTENYEKKNEGTSKKKITKG